MGSYVDEGSRGDGSEVGAILGASSDPFEAEVGATVGTSESIDWEIDVLMRNENNKRAERVASPIFYCLERPVILVAIDFYKGTSYVGN